ncbi:MFS transporter [Mobilitalea sibirica]|uniref:MFS transporter n=1 Tax=Mobilitalea sibirica TaxID=1462919 RepID=A0A8J7HE93_9FIRM|nr:MFS transporter [Mobilitalea sibirica]MBH1941764.1 MFS transporter [Mobilitalea sibirica]
MNKNWKKNIILFMTGQAISIFGSSLVQYAITWFITLNTKSGIMMTISIICGFLPSLVISPFAGVWADRFNRKVIIIAADTMIAVSTLLIAILLYLGFDSVWLLFLVLAIRAVGQGIQSPAVMAAIPQMVPEDKLTRINATNQSIHSVILLFSPLLSGALLGMSTLKVILLIDVFTAAFAVFLLMLFIQIPIHTNTLEKKPLKYLSDMKEGLGYINQHIFIKRLLLFLTICYILVTPVAFLSPLQIAISFGEEVWRLSALEIIFSIGTVLGGVILAAWGGFKNRVYTITLAALMLSVGTMALGFNLNFIIYLAFIAFIGMSMPFFNTPVMVLLQEKVEKEYMGRVFSVMGMIQSSMMPLGMIIFGPLADIINLEWIMIGTGITMFLGCFYLVGDKILIEAGRPLKKIDCNKEINEILPKVEAELPDLKEDLDDLTEELPVWEK